ncbi:formin 1, putative [Plasmodium berghei]|uniref:Formin 1, putative n=2 Tax=Plasmodium berghei TaxID=5821 RepID=A0A509AMX5_PLABA|nr:formin 1, putative [Plasmodium berghei ANKA]CXI84444.1 formin 1, putative [Plasmodium berghei]SCM25783.1 formin 1, putative [Plasmodium berghei]SCN27495.1 formin 1, putative [Plasmodium berghei]SCO62223.1 formin 1, putative [Plasmodium berghei]SCO63922.1 formin 1, putative [Plasmodium berghei]|eukprot:XP_034423128.1 formin 1, putative [Plasmodium berghei ANKA]
MEIKKITLANINDIENEKNVDTLSMITKNELRLTSIRNEKDTKIKNIKFEDSLTINDEQIKVKEAVFILQNMETFNYSITYIEIQNIRNDLRLFAINNYNDKKYSDCLIQAIHSYMIAKKYYSKHFGFYITGDMSTELILICKCYVLIEKYEEGKKYLNELKFLIDNTLLYTHKKELLNEQSTEINKAKNLDSHFEEPYIVCEIQVLSNLLYIFSDLLSQYKQNEEAENYYLKYLYVVEKIFNSDSLNYSDALNDVCSYYIKVRHYEKAIPLCEQILNIRKKFFGDYNSETPNEIIADCYCNLGLLLRLSGNPLNALHKYLIAVDMRMRIHKTRQTIQVQNILFSFAIIMHQLNNFKISLQLYKEVYHFYKTYYGPQDINTTIVLKLIEDLENDVKKEANKNHEQIENKQNLNNNIININDNIMDKKTNSHTYWNKFNEQMKNNNILSKSDLDPNLIENLMNEKVLIKPTNISHNNFIDKRKIISRDGNFKYNDLSYSSIDAYKHMKSNKEFEILKSSYFPISSINRIKSLYGDSWRNTLIPSTYILPFVETNLVDKKLIKFSECKNFQKAIIYKRKVLPVVNVPLIEKGYVKLDKDQPIMICNEDAKTLLNEWNVKEPFVDPKGNVFSKYENMGQEFNMFIPILDENNQVMLGFYDTPLYVPNPAIYHCIILDDPYYFHRYNRDNDLYLIDNLNKKNKYSVVVNHRNVDSNENKFNSTNKDEFSDNKNKSQSSSNLKDTKLNTSIVSNSSTNFLKNDKHDIEITSELKNLEKKSTSNVILKENIRNGKSVMETKKTKSKHIDQSLSLKQFQKEKKDIPVKTLGLNKDKKAQLKIKKFNKIHLLKQNNGNKSLIFSKNKYMPKKNRFNDLFFRSNEKLKLIDHNNINDDNNQLEISIKNIKLNKEPVLKSSIDYNIKMDIENNINKLEQYDIDNLKREIYYENDSKKTKNIHSNKLSFLEDESETVASYREYKKDKFMNFTTKYRQKNINHNDKNANINTKYSENLTNNSSGDSNSNITESESSDDGSSSNGDKDYAIDLHKIFNNNLSSNDYSSNDFSLIPGNRGRYNNGENNFSKYLKNDINNTHIEIYNEKEIVSSFYKNKIGDNMIMRNNKPYEKSIHENNYNTKNINNQYESISKQSNIENNKSHIKETLNNITNVNINDILFKFDLNKNDNSLKSENILSDSDITDDEVYAESSENNTYSISEQNLDNSKNIDEQIENKQSSSIFIQSSLPSMHSNNTNLFNNKSKDNKSSSQSSQNISFYCETNNKLNKNYDEFILSENEEFYNHIIMEDSKIDDQTIEITNFQEINNHLHSYKHKVINDLNMDSNIYDENHDKYNIFNKLQKEYIYEQDNNQAHFDEPLTNSNSQRNTQKTENIDDKSNNSSVVCGVDNTIDAHTDILFLRNNSIEELDSNLITNKYESISMIDETKSDYIENKSNYIENKSNYIENKSVNSINISMDYINIENTREHKDNKISSNRFTQLDNEFDTIFSSNDISYHDKKTNINNLYTHNNKNNLITEKTKKEVESYKNITNNTKNNHSIYNNLMECDISYFSNSNDTNKIKKEESPKNISNHINSNNFNSDNNYDYKNEGRGGRKQNDVPKGKRNKILNMFSFFLKNKKERYNKRKKNKIMNNYECVIDVTNNQINRNDKDALLLNSFSNNVLITNINRHKLNGSYNTVLKDQYVLSQKKKKKLVTESIHGMEKPRLNIKSKFLALKKINTVKNSLINKNSSIEKNNTIVKNNDEKHEKKNNFIMKNPSQNYEKGDNDGSSVKEKNVKEQNGKEHLEKVQDTDTKKDDTSQSEESDIKKIEKKDTQNEEKISIPPKNTPILVKNNNTVVIPKKLVIKKIVPKISLNKASKENENTVSNTSKSIQNSATSTTNTSDKNQQTKVIKQINDVLPFNILRKVKYCKIGSEPDDIFGTLPTVHLLNAEKSVLAIVPWQLDLTSFSLAKSSIEEETIKKIGLLHKELKVSIDDRKKLIEKETKLLTGEGLKELGLTTNSTDAIASVSGINLLSGIDLEMLKKSYKIEKTEVIENNQKSVEKAKSVPIKKEASKTTPKGKGGKKGAPKFMKGPPKGAQGGAVVGKSKFSIKKNQAKDDGKTKRFFWEALFENDIPGTLFEDKKNLITKIEIEKESVEKCFTKIVAKKEGGTELKIKKPKVIQLLPDSKREYNMSIALSKFNNYTFKEIRDAIMDLNPSVLNIDNTEVLMQYVPTPEEFEIVKEYICSNGDLNLVDKPEQYIAALTGVPLLKQRLESHYFALAFKENYENTLNPLENILESCEAIKGSTKLFTILFTILNVGNTLNYGDPQRGNAFGFKLTTLAKLNDIRSSTKPVKTLMQYICEVIYEKSPETLQIIDELRCIENVVRTDKQIIDSLLQKLKVGSTKIKNVIELAKKNPEDPLYDALNEFYCSVEPKIEELEHFYNQTLSVFKDIALYLGYKEKEVANVQIQDLFKELWKFVQSVEFNRKTISENALKELKKKEKQLENEKKGAVLSKKQNFTIVKKTQKDPVENTEKKSFKIF